MYVSPHDPKYGRKIDDCQLTTGWHSMIRGFELRDGLDVRYDPMSYDAGPLDAPTFICGGGMRKSGKVYNFKPISSVSIRCL